MGRIDGDVVGEAHDPLVQGLPQRPGQGFGLVESDQVGASQRADQQRAAGEKGDRSTAIGEQPGEVLGGVTRRCDRPEVQPADVELVAVAETAVRPLHPGRLRGEHGRTEGGQLAAAGEEVGVQMRLDRVGDRHPRSFGGGQIRRGVSRRVDDQRAAVTEVEQVRRVAEPFVDEGDDLTHVVGLRRPGRRERSSARGRG